ncbi:hypothetical protein GGR32_001542 [Mesonia hippocampi]|uniref:Uncharacterized protein n=1 Tax=Mesonia hippocampi TaxID=1628250 RepID=A0A840EUU9_9FLAO|nr:hypothetical protein [Mesonia hippocampi]MBB4119246.1 hypothetical protein [Mesonia hippocampi]
MEDKIKQHYDGDDIQLLNYSADLIDWKDKLAFAETEIRFYKKLLLSSVMEVAENEKSRKDKLKESLLNIEEIHANFFSQVARFSVDAEGINECDDVACETYYLNEHQDYKEKIENFFKNYRTLKEELFVFFEERI